MLDISPKQLELLEFINTYRNDNLRSPSLAEMVKGAHLFDNKSVLRMVKVLCNRGFLTKESKISRSILLTNTGYEKIGASTKNVYGQTSKLNYYSGQERKLNTNSVVIPQSNSHAFFYPEKLESNGTKINADLERKIR